jgi:hypothetical protein
VRFSKAEMVPEKSLFEASLFACFGSVYGGILSMINDLQTMEY